MVTWAAAFGLLDGAWSLELGAWSLQCGCAAEVHTAVSVCVSSKRACAHMVTASLPARSMGVGSGVTC